MKFLARVLIGWGALIALVGVALIVFPHTPATSGPPVVMEVLDPSLQVFAVAWQDEIGRRFPHAVGILCHGGYFVEGQWITSNVQYQHLTTVREVVQHVQAQYPDRTVVLLACNTDHLHLNLPGVFYAHSSVWCIPDRYLDGSMLDNLTIDQATAKVLVNPATQPYRLASRWQNDPDVIGNIFEFTTDN